jgi:hypothetical protein
LKCLPTPYAGLTCNRLTTSGAVLGWELLVHHVAIHAVFHIALRFALKIGGRLMDKVFNMVNSMKQVSSKIVAKLTELSFLVLVTVAATI